MVSLPTHGLVLNTTNSQRTKTCDDRTLPEKFKEDRSKCLDIMKLDILCLEQNRLEVVACHSEHCVSNTTLQLSCDFPEWGDPLDECDQLFPYVRSIINNRYSTPTDLEARGLLLVKVSDYLWRRRDYRLAISYAEQAVAQYESLFGTLDPRTLRSVHTLARVHQYQGNFALGEKYAREASEGWKAVRGDAHIDTIGSLGILARCTLERGDEKSAIVMFQHVYEVTAKLLGGDDPGTLDSRQDLCDAYEQARQWALAEELGRQIVEGRTIILGPTDPDTLTSMHHLANALIHQDKLDEAELLCEDVLSQRTHAFGKEHPSTLLSLAQKASLLRLQHHLPSADALIRTTITSSTRLLGPDHPTNIAALAILAAVLHAQCQHPAAENLCRRILATRTQTLGPVHRDTLDSTYALAATLTSQSQHAEATTLLTALLALQNTHLGPRHEDTLTTTLALAESHSAQSNLATAVSLYRLLLEREAEVYGPRHPHTLGTTAALAGALAQMERWDEAEGLFRSALGGWVAGFSGETAGAVEAGLGVVGVLVARGEVGEGKGECRGREESKVESAGEADITGLLAEGVGGTGGELLVKVG